MSATKFQPERSAAIRQLLLDTAAEEPRRRRRVQILLTAALSGLAIVLAGGTAALAFTGVIHFGAPAAPAPIMSTTPTVTPEPTAPPTPAPSRAPRAIQVQDGPIVAHDVTSLPASPAWSLDLPGDASACQQRDVYNIADGLALFVIGSNQGSESTTACPIGHAHASVTMVDTVAGAVVWSREWTWDGDKGYGTFLSVLGTSNRAMFVSESGGDGPRAILDLRTGSDLATLADLGSYPNWKLTPIWDASGDVVYAKPVVDGDGQTTAVDLERVDPRDLSAPTWVTTLTAAKASVSIPNFAGTGLVPIEFESADPSGGWQSGLLDLTTGAVSAPAPSATHVAVGGIIVDYRDMVDGIPTTIAGVDRTTGADVWSRPFAPGSSVSEVTSTSDRPGWLAGRPGAPTGDLAIVSPTTLTLLDGATGSVTMTADTTHCGVQAAYWANGGPQVLLDESRNSVVVVRGPYSTCSIDRSTGAPTPLADHDLGPWPQFGPQVTYFAGASLTSAGTGAAYDRRTGAQLWSAPAAAGEEWFFAGGVLVRQVGGHIEAIG